MTVALAVPEDLEAWLWLVHQPGLGRGAMRRLLAALGSPAAVAAASDEALGGLLTSRQLEALRQPAAVGAGDRAAVTQAWLGASNRRRLMTLADRDYPALLLQTADPPLLLYADGDASLLGQPSLAIVGSRRPTPQGLANARHFSQALSREGWTIVSGLASGIDGAAHLGGLSERGRTVAVVGTGLDEVYPRSHKALARRIVEEGGLMLSEFPLGSPPIPEHFPQRNRIIAGLTRGTLVVEAALRSGSLITARQAAEAGREVFAVPGSIHSPQARGCHALLRDGAKLVETVEDILEELTAPARQVMAAPLITGDSADMEPEDAVLRALGHDPVSLDALIARCGWPASELSVRLLELELEGCVARLPGGLYQRLQSA